MREIRLSIIQNHADPAKDKRVDIHITDADAVLGVIARGKDKYADKVVRTPPPTEAPEGTPGGTETIAGPASRLQELINEILHDCGDTDKIEIGVDSEGKPNPASGFVARGDGSGLKVPFAL